MTTLKHLIDAIIPLACEYYTLTGKPLGATGEIGEHVAAETLGLALTPARTQGHDATDSKGRTIQIKTRYKQDGQFRGRVGRIDITKAFDSVMLVLMSGQYELDGIWEADRQTVIEALEKPGSRARNDRGQLSIQRFKAIARRVWPK